MKKFKIIKLLIAFILLPCFLLTGCKNDSIIEDNSPIKNAILMELGERQNIFKQENMLSLKYEIEDNSIIKIDENGNITALKIGQTYIIAKHNEVQKRCCVNVILAENMGEIFEIDYYNSWRDKMGKLGSKLVVDNVFYKANIGFVYNHADNCPLIVKNNISYLNVKTNRLGWLILWSDMKSKAHFAVNMETLQCAILDAKSITGIREEDNNFLKNIYPDAENIKIDENFQIEYLNELQKYIITSNGKIIFEIEYSDINESFGTDNFLPRIGFAGINEATCYTLADIKRFSENGTTDKFVGEDWLAIGDSITHWGAEYLVEVSQRLGVNNYINAGIGGALLSEYSSGIVINSVVNRIKNNVFAKGNYGLITIFAGTNDYGYNAPLGEIGSNDTATFAGAIKFTMDYFIQNYPNSEIVVINALYRIGIEGGNFYLYNKILKNIVDEYTIKNNNVLFIDMYNESGITASNQENYTKDGLHPNTEGYKLVSQCIIENLNKKFI
jgi:lysophospholipase L1-like esterase